MKFFNLLILALCFCACATGSRIEKSSQTAKQEIPVFMTNGAKRTALKTSFDIKNKSYNFLLLATKKGNYINFKIIGDFASVLASVNLRGNSFDYEIISPIFSEETAKALEEILLTLFVPNENLIKQSKKVSVYKQGNLKQKYYFKEGEILPYKLKQTSPIINKTFLFENYDANGKPHKITVNTKYNLIKIDLELLAHD